MLHVFCTDLTDKVKAPWRDEPWLNLKYRLCKLFYLKKNTSFQYIAECGQ